MKWPFVSRRAFELLESQLERVIKERDEYREEAARARDELITRLGCEPVSLPVRTELKAAQKEVESYIEQFNYEAADGVGMIDADVLKLVDEAVAKEMPKAN